MTSIEEQLGREREKFRSIQQIARATGSVFDLDELLHLIVGKITELMDADRSTLYLMDEEGDELWTKVLQADELREIRLKVGEGLAGWVAAKGEIVNIPDAYEDDRFSPDTDRRSGYRTQSVLCAPMKNNQGQIIGVVQVLNKKGGNFTAEDEELLEALASQASIAVENTELYSDLERRVRELDLLLDLEQRVLSATFSLEEMLEGLLTLTTEMIGAEAGSILLQDEYDGRLYFRSAMGERRDALRTVTVAMGEGIAGWVAQHREPARVDDPPSDPRHNQKLARQVGFTPRNILCVPLSSSDSVRGAIELLNKVGRDRFDRNDLRLLTLIAARTTQAIELARAKEQRMRDARLASIGQLMSGVLHDLKTPMTIISGYAQLMAQHDEESVRKQYVDQILRQFDVMSAMTREVLAFARGETRVLIRKVYLHKFLREMTEHLQHAFAGKNIELLVNQNYRGVAFIDETKFCRVFHNIGRNAAQAMPDGGRFEVTVDTDDDKLIFTFRDTGSGIPAEVEGRLFETFASAGKEEGTGLGLAIVKKIVEEHSGEISYASTPGEGTTFTITIPRNLPSAQTGEVSISSTAVA